MSAWAARISGPAAAIMLLAAGSLGCGQVEEETGAPGGLRGAITVSGAGTTIFILKPLAAEFSAAHPEVVFNFFPSTHTTGGIAGAKEEILDIGALSRHGENIADYPDFQVRYFCREAIVFIANPNAAVKTMDRSRVLDLYAGRIEDWSEIGGSRMRTVVVGRPEYSSGKRMLDEQFFPRGFVFTPTMVIVEKAQDALRAIQETRGAFGYASLGMVSGSRAPVEVVELNGEPPPTEENILNENYPLIITHGIFFREDAPAHVWAFARFVDEGEADELLRKLGYVPL